MFFSIKKTVESLNANLPHSRLLYNFIESLIEETGDILRNRIFDVLQKGSVLDALFALCAIKFSDGSYLLRGKENANFITKKIEEMRRE